MSAPTPFDFYRPQLEEAIERYRLRTGYRVISPMAALIDMDGTLFDSMANHAAAWQRMVSEQGIQSREEEFLLWEGRTGASVIDELMMRSRGRHATAEEIERLYTLKTRYFRELEAPVAMPGAAAMLGALRDAGVKCVLVTGSGQNSLISRLGREFPGAFAEGMLVTARDVKQGKPSPEPFLKGMERASAAPWQSIAIDNAPLGVEAGTASGAFTIGVVTGAIPPQALADAGADFVVEGMDRLGSIMPDVLATLKTTQKPDSPQ